MGTPYPKESRRVAIAQAQGAVYGPLAMWLQVYGYYGDKALAYGVADNGLPGVAFGEHTGLLERLCFLGCPAMGRLETRPVPGEGYPSIFVYRYGRFFGGYPRKV